MGASSDVWWGHAPERAKRERAMAIVDYALACGYLDEWGHRDFQRAVSDAAARDVAGVVADMPVPRWDQMAPAEPVDGPQRDYAVALLGIAARIGWLSGADRKWRSVFAVHARTAADLLVLFLDVEPRLRRRRKDPEMVRRLARLAFVPELLQARGRGRLSRADFDDLLERTASGESFETLRAALRDSGQADSAATADHPPRHADKPAREGPSSEAAPAREPVRDGERGSPAADPPAIDLDRARIARYLQQALAEERLGPGEHAARIVALWSATTARQLAELVVDLPVPRKEPLRDRKRDAHSDNLIAPADRQAVVDRLDQAMTDHTLTLWEYETRLVVALTAQTYAELRPAADGLDP